MHGNYNVVPTCISKHFTCLRVKSFPTVSRSTLKKHSTSSVVLERGCSAGSPCSRRNSLRLTLVSISAARAISVSLVNPQTLLSSLTKQNKKVITTTLQ